MNNYIIIDNNGNESKWIKLNKLKILNVINNNINKLDFNKQIEIISNKKIISLTDMMHDSCDVKAMVRIPKQGTKKNFIDSTNKYNGNIHYAHDGDKKKVRKYIINNVLNIGKTNEEIKSNMEDILCYIYKQIPLDHNKMIKLYEYIRVPVDFDDQNKDDNSDYNDYYRWNLKFTNYYKKNDKYFYKLDDRIDMIFYENKSLIDELHKFLLMKSPVDLYIGDFNLIILMNHWNK